MDLKQTEYEVESCDSRALAVAGCEHGVRSSSAIKAGNFMTSRAIIAC
jgi:hypothetical protein